MTDAIDIKALREAKGWTQEKVAEFLGVDRSVVSRMEHGQAQKGPTLKLLQWLATDVLPPELVAPVSSDRCDP